MGEFEIWERRRTVMTDAKCFPNASQMHRKCTSNALTTLGGLGKVGKWGFIRDFAWRWGGDVALDAYILLKRCTIWETRRKMQWKGPIFRGLNSAERKEKSNQARG